MRLMLVVDVVESFERIFVVGGWERKFDAINSWSKFCIKPDIDSANELGGEEFCCCRILSLWYWIKLLELRFFVLDIERLFVVTIRWTFNGAGANGRPGLGAMGINGGFAGGRIEVEVVGGCGKGIGGGGGFFRFRAGFLFGFFVEVKRLFVGGIEISIDFDWSNCGDRSKWCSSNDVDGESIETVDDVFAFVNNDGVKTLLVVVGFVSLWTTGV